MNKLDSLLEIEKKFEKEIMKLENTKEKEKIKILNEIKVNEEKKLLDFEKEQKEFLETELKKLDADCKLLKEENEQILIDYQNEDRFDKVLNELLKKVENV